MTETSNGKPRPVRKRQYWATPEGLAALRASAGRVKPWARSTGPTSEAGRDRAKMNALKHGERSAETLSARRDATAALRVVRELSGDA